MYGVKGQGSRDGVNYLVRAEDRCQSSFLPTPAWTRGCGDYHKTLLTDPPQAGQRESGRSGGGCVCVRGLNQSSAERWHRSLRASAGRGQKYPQNVRMSWKRRGRLRHLDVIIMQRWQGHEDECRWLPSVCLSLPGLRRLPLSHGREGQANRNKSDFKEIHLKKKNDVFVFKCPSRDIDSPR